MLKKVKVLFIYPNTPLLNPPPVAIGIFSALLKAENIEVKVFDTTYYVTKELSSDKAKEETLQVRPFNFNENQLPLQTSNPEEDLKSLVADYQPDLIGISVLEGTWKMAKKLLDVLIDVQATIIAGGVFATFAPDIILEHPAISMVCIGEGEKPLLEICSRIKHNKNFFNIKNLWIKNFDGTITKQQVSSVVNINEGPISDYEVFHPARLLRPMAGKIYRTIPLETNRGCPYTCTFCNSPAISQLYREANCGNYFRKKSLNRIEKELRYLINKWDAEYVYFLSDTFLAMSDTEFNSFIEIYREFKLPFWIQTRPETITLHRARKLKEIGCHRMSMGLEHGNHTFRSKILKKKFSDNQIIDATKILAEVGIPLTVNNIIGFPDETRELIFDTIELNRKLQFDSSNAYVFSPFHGTELYEYSLKQGYINEKDYSGCFTIDTPLEMKHLSKKEINGIRKTFALYAKLPKEYWPEIKKAESNDDNGRKAYAKLREIYQDRFFN